MTSILLPASILLEDDGRTVWGMIRASVDNHVVVRVELAQWPRHPGEDPTWLPFCTLTVAQGHIAFRIHDDDDTDTTVERLRADIEAGIQSGSIHPPGAEANRQSPKPLRHNLVLCNSKVGEDAPDSNAEGERVDPGDGAGSHEGS